MTVDRSAPTIGLAVLSWGAPETLTRTLESYQTSGLFDLFDCKLIYFNDFDAARDRSVAERFGCEAAGGPNSGITGGMIAMAEALSGCDQVLLMQNDLPAMTTPSETARELTFAVEQIAAGHAQLANLRHRWLPGQGFGRVGKYLRYWPLSDRDRDSRYDPREHSNVSGVATGDPIAKRLKRALRPASARLVAGGSYYVASEPDRLHPNEVRSADGGYLITSSAMTYSDQSLLIDRKFYLETLVPYIRANRSRRTIQGFPDAEAIINHRTWWRQQGFTIAHGQSGIFSHDRRDGFQA